jgi:hypothetical protein
LDAKQHRCKCIGAAHYRFESCPDYKFGSHKYDSYIYIRNLKQIVMILFKGKKAKIGPVKTMDIKLSDIWSVFFPADFHQKYRYLGSVPWNEKGDIFEAMKPLVIFMDYKARPWWCPRWFLRFLHLFGNDNSIVRVRNQKLHKLHKILTKGIFIWDYKTKWEHYDLRISVSGDDQINFLVSSIEEKFYIEGYREELIRKIKKYDPLFAKYYLPLDSLKEIYSKFEEDLDS